MSWIKKIRKTYRAEGLHGLRRATIRRLRPAAVHPVRIALEEVLRGDGFTIVQIGAYVGNTGNDPLFETLSRGLQQGNGSLIVVEPVREYFDKLVESYRGVPGVAFENVAVSDHVGQATFYRLGVDPMEHGYPDWLTQLGSLKKERMERLWDRYEGKEEYKEFYLRHRIAETVDCVSFEELARRYRLSKVDLLQIDVEGAELDILRTIDFRAIPIRFVNYECVLLQDRKREVERLMQRSGYRCFDHGQDTFCWKKPDGHLKRRWTRRGGAQRYG